MGTPAKSGARIQPRGSNPPGPSPHGPPPLGAHSPPDAPPPEGRPRRPGRRSVFPVAFLISAVLHIVLVALYPLLWDRGSSAPFPGSSAPVVRPPGTELIRLREVAGDAPVAPAPVRAVDPQAVVSSLPPAQAAPSPAPLEIVVGGPPAGPLPTLPGSVAERLRPGQVDRRLWAIPREATLLEPSQLAQLRLLWAILELNDSTALAEAAARSLTDWTFTDDDGGRWGISPSGLHLGDFTLPLPFPVGATPGSPAARRAWEDAEIARGAGAAAARENLNQRIRAIQERMDRERRPVPVDSGGPP